MMHKFTSTRRFQASALALALAATVCFGSLVSADNRFTDVPDSHWAHDAIEYVVDEGLFAGTSETTFNPEGTMTRAMLWVVLARMDDVNTNASSGEVWYQPGLDWAVENGISDGTNPNNNITREQFAAMLYRYAENAGEDITADTAELNKFIDTINISSYALQPLAWAVENGIVSGTSSDTISPAGNATRAQVATMLMRYDKAFNDDTQSDNPGGETTHPEETETPDVDYKLTIALMNSNLSVGDKVMADMNTIPSTAKDGLTFTFKSSDTSVATVKAYSGNSFSCEITAVGPGTTVITATDSNGVSATRTITVKGNSSNPGTSTSDDYADVKDEIIELTNEVRAEHGAAALTKSDLLMKMAQQRADESAEMQKTDHTRPDGTDMYTILAEYGLDFLKVQFNENLATAYDLDAELVVNALAESSGHLQTMTATNKTLIGVGIARGDDGRYYFCQIFTNMD